VRNRPHSKAFVRGATWANALVERTTFYGDIDEARARLRLVGRSGVGHVARIDIDRLI
jgi:hypothetical protein